MEKTPISVSETVALINQTLEYALQVLVVEGEVSLFKVNQGKYVFFDLKDEESSLGCFMTVWQLRMPLEDGEVRVSRAAGSVLLPARIQLVAAMNPCPCGLYGDPDRECGCAPQRLAAYRARISGPLLDRFDLQVDVPRVDAHGAPGESTAAVAPRVDRARQLLAERRPVLGDAAGTLLRQAADRRFLSGRGVDRAQRVAQTIAALSGEAEIAADHIAEALSYRTGSLG